MEPDRGNLNTTAACGASGPGPKPLTAGRTLTVSFLITLAVWLLFSWPLPRYFGSGMAWTSERLPHETVRRMVNGDHLQLLYSFWLFSDVMTGNTPYYYNLYEFNTGPADEWKLRCKPIDDLPFSIVFTLAQFLVGRAAAWNLTGLLALWVTYLFTWLWLRRYTTHPATAAVAALVVLTLPYRWATLCGGSPTGYAMTWVPILLWGIERIIREGHWTGTLAATAAIAFAYANDSHVFLFSLLLAPAWGVVVLTHHAGFDWRSLRTWRRLILAGLPVLAVTGVLAILGSHKQAGLAASMGMTFRTWQEVALYSPMAGGVFCWSARGHTQTIYIGFAIAIVGAMGTLACLAAAAMRPRERWRQAAILALLWLGIVVAILLALGTNGPHNGKPMDLARQFIPAYKLIRQPIKIFVILPTLLAALVAVSLEGLSVILTGGRALALALAITAAALLTELKVQVDPAVSLLDTEQGAYAAVEADARAAGAIPRLVALPIWPGDSAWSSVYEHYATLYRIRMLNGYTPGISKEYREKIGFFFDTANVGVLTDRQVDDLLARGIRHLVLHEDAFPEQVSPFSVAWTLSQLLNHPRLEPLAHDRNVWAFRILDRPAPGKVTPPPPLVSSSWCATFEPENAERPSTTLKPEAGCSNGHAVSLDNPASKVTLLDVRHWNLPSPALLIRARGAGELKTTFTYAGGAVETVSLPISSKRWAWVEAPINPALGESATPVFTVGNGAVDLDLVILTGGPRLWMKRGESLTVPAVCFFHSGYSDRESMAVHLRRENEPYEEMLYGPKAPFADGSYVAEMRYRADAPAGTTVGELNVRVGEEVRFGPNPVVAGLPARIAFSTAATNLPVRFGFTFHRAADVEIRDVTFTRTE